MHKKITLKMANYFPILPLGRASAIGISNAILESSSNVMPIFIPQNSWVDPITLKPQYSPEQQAFNVANILTQNIPEGSSFGLQIPSPKDSTCYSDLQFKSIFESLIDSGNAVVPVLLINGPNIKCDLVEGLVSSSTLSRWVFRLSLTNRGASADDLRGWIVRALDITESDPSITDLILDLGYVGGWTVTNSTKGVEHWIRRLSEGLKWKSITLACSSLPSYYRDSAADAFYVIRDEWSLYRELQKRVGSDLDISFADYSVLGSPSSLCPPVNVSAMYFPYSIDGSWYVFKGEYGAMSVVDQCCRFVQRLTEASSVYMGPDFSIGDSHLAKLAAGSFRKDDLAYYVGITSSLISHHSAVIGKQLKNI